MKISSTVTNLVINQPSQGAGELQKARLGAQHIVDEFTDSTTPAWTDTVVAERSALQDTARLMVIINDFEVTIQKTEAVLAKTVDPAKRKSLESELSQAKSELATRKLRLQDKAHSLQFLQTELGFVSEIAAQQHVALPDVPPSSGLFTNAVRSPETVAELLMGRREQLQAKWRTAVDSAFQAGKAEPVDESQVDLAHFWSYEIVDKDSKTQKEVYVDEASSHIYLREAAGLDAKPQWHKLPKPVELFAESRRMDQDRTFKDIW